MWNKKGNFQNAFRSEGPLNRHVIYVNDASDAVIKELCICGYKDGDFQIIVKARDQEAFQQLNQIAINVGFSEPAPFDQDMKIIRLTTKNRDATANFIKVIKIAEKDFSEIEKEVCSTLNISLPENNERLNKAACKIQFWYRRTCAENAALDLIENKDTSLLAQGILQRRSR